MWGCAETSLQPAPKSDITTFLERYLPRYSYGLDPILASDRRQMPY